ncbi:MAG: hypothetical protein ACKOCX_11370, partial [Planctomycetota bacterium]
MLQRIATPRRLGIVIALAAAALPADSASAADAAAVAADAAAAAAARVEALGGKVTRAADGGITAIAIADGGGLSADDLRLFGGLPKLESLVLLNCRSLDDAFVEALGDKVPLRTLAMTNSALTDAGVAAIVAAFP